jgi:hypothetical protein
LQKSRGVAGTRFEHGRRGSDGTCGRNIGKNGVLDARGFRFEAGNNQGKSYEDCEQSAHGTS